MGCFNQVCLLTRAPITSGDDVVVWEEIKGPWYNTEMSNGKTGLLFGLPQRAEYDDYGGAEDYKDDELFAMHERAWAGQALYRSHKVKASYESKTLYIAATGDTMTNHNLLSPLFYGEQEINPKDVFENGYEEAFREKQNRATARAQAVLTAVGERIGKAKLPNTEAECLAACFHIVQEEVGPHLAWAVWNVLSEGELFAKRGLCMMRAEAYDYIVRTTGEQRVSAKKADKTKMTYREKTAALWDTWEKKRAGVTSKNPLIASMMLKEARLMPMALPWEIAEMPFTGFYWNAIPYEELVQTVGKEAFLDALMFMTGLRYLRVGMRAESGGSQNEHWQLHQGVMNAVYAKQKEEGPLRSDWELS